MNIIIISFSIIFTARLFFLQVNKGTELKVWSDSNHIKPQKVRATRGMIFDRNGKVLVDNSPDFVAVIVPQYASELSKTANEASKILSLDPNEIIDKVKKTAKAEGQFKPVVIKKI